jgi:hypothetical protein
MFLLLIGLILPLPIQQANVESSRLSHRNPLMSVVASKDEDAVKAACKLWWNLPEMRTTSKEDMHKWAKQVLPTAGKALSKATEAKALNRKWSQFQLEMATFYGSIYLGTDIRYAGVMFQSALERNAINNLSKTCAKRR